MSQPSRVAPRWRVARSVRRMREQLVRDGRDGVGREPVPDAAESDETSVRDLGGERLTVADREERVVLAVQHQRRRGDLAEPLAPARAVVGEREVCRRALTSVVLATSASALARAEVSSNAPAPASALACSTRRSTTDRSSDQSGCGVFMITSMSAASCPGRSSSTGPGVFGRLAMSVSVATRSGWPRASNWAIQPPVDIPATWARLVAVASSTPTASSTRSARE